MNKKIKVIVDDVELEVLVSEEELAKLTKKQKKTGYEQSRHYYCVNGLGLINANDNINDSEDNGYYNSANYYSDKTVAENNARADKLMRQLRRFAAENCEEVNCHYHWYIYYNCTYKKIDVDDTTNCKRFGVIHFDTEENAQKAIDTFKDELMWYFTEYRDRA